MEILKFPNKILKEKSKSVDDIRDVLQIVEDMKITLKESGGIGLAAPQVGHNLRIILVQERVYYNSDTSGQMIEFKDTRIDTHVMINPVVTWASNDKYVQVEGCLSFPGVTTRINRHQAVRVKWMDYEGVKEKMFSGLTAACIQHECDHLDGILLSDKIGPLRIKFTQEYFKKNK